MHSASARDQSARAVPAFPNRSSVTSTTGASASPPRSPCSDASEMIDSLAPPGGFTSTAEPETPVLPTRPSRRGSTTAGGGAAADAAAGNTRVQLRVLSHPRYVFVVDRARVFHIPTPVPQPAVPSTTDDDSAHAPVGSAQDTPATQRSPSTLEPALTLCRHYDVRNPAHARCPRGAECPFVHADVRGATRYSPHTVEGGLAGLFHTYRPGVVVRVGPPPKPRTATATGDGDDTTPDGTFEAPSACLLRTRAVAFDSDGRMILDPAPPSVGGIASMHAASSRSTTAPSVVVTMCAHFAQKRRCDRGPRCKFAHVLPGVPAASFAAGASSGASNHRGASAAFVADATASRSALAPAVAEASQSVAASFGSLDDAWAGHRGASASLASVSRAGMGATLSTSQVRMRHEPYTATPLAPPPVAPPPAPTEAAPENAGAAPRRRSV